ncbi:hypothetical protein KKC60_02765 [Patescibacteria group bacterium]|nr:hypothetical protein [Patescibacteria group bacterium]
MPNPNEGPKPQESIKEDKSEDSSKATIPEQKTPEDKPKTTATTPPKKKSKVLYYILGGCGGCLVLLLIGLVIAWLVAGATMRSWFDGSSTDQVDEIVKEAEKKALETEKEAKEKAEKALEEAKKEADKNKKEAEENKDSDVYNLKVDAQVGITDNVGHFTPKSTFRSDVDNVSILVDIKGAKPQTQVTVEWYDPFGSPVEVQTEAVGSKSEIDFLYLTTMVGLTPGTNEYVVLVGGLEMKTGTFEVEQAPTQNMSPTSLDPTTYNYEPLFIWPEEFFFDWATYDIDGDGYEEGCILTKNGDNEEYHVFVLDWNPNSGLYTKVYDNTYEYPTTRIMLKDWGGDSQKDFVLVHTENSGDASAIIYENGSYVMTSQ